MPPYVVIHKALGQTPLQALEAWRKSQGPAYAKLPLTYAGRLDPMAEGKLLILIGEECKRQALYHNLDKAYDFSILFGVASDTFDVLGRRTNTAHAAPSPREIQTALISLTGRITLPYPAFSSKTVGGIPLHTHTLQGTLPETLPTKTSMVYRLNLLSTETMPGSTIAAQVCERIALVTPVTDPKKALGNDFRRADVLTDWELFAAEFRNHTFTIAHCRAIASSGTYMRSLAVETGKKLGVPSLAFSISRTAIGHYQPLPFSLGFWLQRFR